MSINKKVTEFVSCRVMSVPFMVASIISVTFEYAIDSYGQRPLLLVAAALMSLSGHASLLASSYLAEHFSASLVLALVVLSMCAIGCSYG